MTPGWSQAGVHPAFIRWRLGGVALGVRLRLTRFSVCHLGLRGRQPEAGQLYALGNVVEDQGGVYAGRSNPRVD